MYHVRMGQDVTVLLQKWRGGDQQVLNALLPLVTMLGLQSAAMLGGSVVIESIFAIPGFGRLAFEAVGGRDAPLLLGVILVSAVLVIVVNLLVDLVYAAVDPRVGSGTGGGDG